MPLIPKGSISIAFIIMWALVSVNAARAQNNDNARCRGPIYATRDVTQRAKIIEGPSLNIPKEAAAQSVHGQVVVNAILCRNGRVTDIQVVKGLPLGITE